MLATQTIADLLNDLLSGELAAVEAYERAMQSERADELRHIHDDHLDAAHRLRQDVANFGGRPALRSGVWGAFSRAVAAAAQVLGTRTTLQALKEGEEHGVRAYRRALVADLLPLECQLLISTSLLPQTEDHVQSLNHLIHAS
jgi:demethoxyubiquinone hydroxylase (CLK1/Coq7/Cat5 family)